MAELVFYTNPMSRGRMIRWLLEELGRPYETHVLDYGTTMKAPEYLAINPMGKVPALVHNGAVITEVAAICAYVADAFPEAGLAPPHTGAERAAYYRALFFAAGPVEQAVANKACGFLPSAEQARFVGYGSFDGMLDTLQALVSKTPYAAGDSFTAADVYLGSQVGWGMQFGTIERRPAFEAYWERVSTRPAAIRARQIDDALLPPKG